MISSQNKLRRPLTLWPYLRIFNGQYRDLQHHLRSRRFTFWLKSNFKVMVCIYVTRPRLCQVSLPARHVSSKASRYVPCCTVLFSIRRRRGTPFFAAMRAHSVSFALVLRLSCLFVPIPFSSLPVICLLAWFAGSDNCIARLCSLISASQGTYDAIVAHALSLWKVRESPHLSSKRLDHSFQAVRPTGLLSTLAGLRCGYHFRT